MNKKYLPSKKFAISLLIALAIIGISLVITFGKSSFYESKKVNGVVVDNSKLEVFKQVDTDSDGLPDWQETLYGTDPKKADTDGDGTNDEDEMKVNRDPIKASTSLNGQEPNDKIDPKIIEQIKKAETEYENLNDTEKFARNFLSQYIASQPSGRQMTEDEQNAIVNKMLSESEVEILQDHFSEEDIKIIEKPTLEQLSKYIKDVSNVLREISPNFSSSFDIASTLEEANNYNNVKKLDPIIKQYISSANKVMEMKIPKESSIYHINFANDIYKLADYLTYIKMINSDPLKSIKGLQGYSETFLKARSDFKILTDKIISIMQTY